MHAYNVDISPTFGTTRRVKKRIFELAEAHPDWTRFGLKNNVAHDCSAKLIAANKLEPQPLVISVPYYDEDEDGPKLAGKTYTLTITFIESLDIQSLTQCVDTIFPIFLLTYHHLPAISTAIRSTEIMTPTR